MSKTYRCRVKRDLTDIIREKDRIVYRLRLLPVADKEKMKQWFRQALIDDGANENEDGTLEMDMDGVRVEIDVENDEVKIVSETEDDLHIQIDEDRKVYNRADNEEKAQEKAEEDVNKEVKKTIEDKQKEVRDKAVKILREAEGKVKTRIRKAENKTIEKGLDEKADSMGDVVQKEEEAGVNGDRRVIWRVRLN